VDEADHIFFDDFTHYRFATPLHQNDISYVYPVIYRYVNSEKFKNPANTIEDDIVQAREALLDYARAQKPNEINYVTQLADRQIDTWLDAARLAIVQLKEDRDFVVREEERGEGEDIYKVSFARILSNSRVSLGAEYSNGVQQFLHARLNEERVTRQRKIPPFPIDPETAPIASISSKNVIEHHMARGRVIGVTGTAGSIDELRELQEMGIRSYRIPPHQPNQRKIEPHVLVKGENLHFATICKVILKYLRKQERLGYLGYEADPKPQPILVGFKEIDKSQRFYDYLLKEITTPAFKNYKNIIRTQLLNGSTTMVDGKKSDCGEEEILSNGGVSGFITVSTMLDRGSDFKPRLHADDLEQNHPLGLLAILTFVASERLMRQFAGRGARQGHIGFFLMVLDENEFDELLTVADRTLGLEAVHLLQQQRAQADRSRRRFADRLGEVKSYFFDKYVAFMQDDKNQDVDLNRKWAACLSNMDIEWHRLMTLNFTRNFTTPEALYHSTSGLIRKACKDWNFLVASKRHFMMRPLAVEKAILYKQTPYQWPDTEEDCYNGKLKIHDVSAAKHYVEKSPLFITMDIKGDAQNEMVLNIIEQKRLITAYECLEQIFEEKLDFDFIYHSLATAFKNLIAKAFADQPIQFRKKLIEIFAIGRWSKNQNVEQQLPEIFLSCLYDFILTKIIENKTHPISIDNTLMQENLASGKTKDIEALLRFLKRAKNNHTDQRKRETDNMNIVQTTVDTAVDLVSTYLYGSMADFLKKLIDLADHPFTREPKELDSALQDAQSSQLYEHSWCVLFNPVDANERMLHAQADEAETKASSSWTYVGV
jgi:hypothetical protein